MALGRLARTLRKPWVLVPVQLANAVGIVYGFYYYLPQFEATPAWLWPLVPDSPFAVLLMAIALGVLIAGHDDDRLTLVGAAAMVKVGLWTAVVLAWFPEHFSFSLLPDLACPTDVVFGCGNLNTYLFYLHLGMAAEVLLVADLLPTRPLPYLAVGGAFLAADAIDYLWPVDYLARGCDGIFPHTVPCDHHGLTFLVTAALTVGTLIALNRIAHAAREETPSEPP